MAFAGYVSMKLSSPQRNLHTPSNLFLGEPFEITGHWWLPSDTGKTVIGTLRYSAQESLLELIGNFDEGADPQPTFSGERVETIHGVSSGGLKVSLLRNFVSSRSHLFGTPIRTIVYSAIHIVAGAHVTEQSTFGSLEFYPDALNEFVLRNSFKTDWPRAEDDPILVSVEHAKPMEYPFDLRSRDAVITLKARSQFSPGRSHTSITVEEFFDIEPKSSQTLDWFIQQMWRLCYLLRLLTNMPVMPRQAIIGVADSHEYASLLYRYHPSDREFHDSLDMLFRMGDVQENFGEVLDKWFSASESLVTAIHLFMHGQSTTSDSVGRFLTLSQALETFSRAKGHAEYLSEAEWKPFRDRLTAAIPSEVAPAHRKSLEKRIEHGHEYSLRKRIKLLLESLSEKARSLVCSSPSAFVSGVADTRNYLTHYTEELKGQALHGAELHWACERMLMLLRFLLLKEIGISEDLSCTRVAENSTLMQHIHLYRQFRECVE